MSNRKGSFYVKIINKFISELLKSQRRVEKKLDTKCKELLQIVDGNKDKISEDLNHQIEELREMIESNKCKEMCEGHQNTKTELMMEEKYNMISLIEKKCS